MFGTVVMIGTLNIQQCYDWEMVWLGYLMLLLWFKQGSKGKTVMFGSDVMIGTLNIKLRYEWDMVWLGCLMLLLGC